MSILDRLQSVQLDVHNAIDLESKGELYPMRYSRGFILVLYNIQDIETYIEKLYRRISYLFGPDDMCFSVCRNSQRIEELSLVYNFNIEDNSDQLLIIIQFNNPKGFHKTIRMYIKFFLCIISDYIETPDAYLSDVISIYATTDKTEFYRDYSTKSYTPGIFWKYYYSETYDDFRAKEHIIRCLNYKFTPFQNDAYTGDHYNNITNYLKEYKDVIVRRIK